MTSRDSLKECAFDPIICRLRLDLLRCWVSLDTFPCVRCLIHLRECQAGLMGSCRKNTGSSWVVLGGSPQQIATDVAPERVSRKNARFRKGYFFARRGYFGSPRLSQRPSIFEETAGSITISSGHGRANPSLGHLRVASTPIFEPKSWMRAA